MLTKRNGNLQGVLHNQDIIAVKRIKMNSDTVDDGIFSRELENLIHIMKHPNVVSFLATVMK